MSEWIDSAEREEWRDIEGWDGYQISSCGRARSVDRYVDFQDRTKFCRGSVITPMVDLSGYHRVGLTKNNHRVYLRVDKLVASTFLPDYSDDLYIVHKNGDILDSSLHNITLMTTDEYLTAHRDASAKSVCEDGEEWRDIEGHSGYQISSMGRARTIDRYVENSHNKKGMRLLKGKILFEYEHPSGRLKVRIIDDAGNVDVTFIDELVAAAFLRRKDGCEYLVHLDGDVSNSEYTNLKWMEEPSRIEADGEEWRPIVGWEDYEVSNRGHVRRPSRVLVNKDGKKFVYKERVLKLKTTDAGFVFVSLLDDNRGQHTHFVDRLVADAFLPNDSELKYVGHRNGELDDNRVENLFWCNLDSLNETLDKDSVLVSITLPDEKWADIDGYVGLYLISNYGRVYSIPRYSIINGFPHIIGGYILKSTVVNTGYKAVVLAADSTNTTYNIHRLVASAFVKNPNPAEYTQVNHLDEDKTNNFYLNLQWCTPLQNTRHGTGIQRATAKRDYKRIKKPVLQFDRNGSFIKAWESLASIQRGTGFLAKYIGLACNRGGAGSIKDGIAYGYKWYFEEDYGCVD